MGVALDGGNINKKDFFIAFNLPHRILKHNSAWFGRAQSRFIYSKSILNKKVIW